MSKSLNNVILKININFHIRQNKKNKNYGNIQSKIINGV